MDMIMKIALIADVHANAPALRAVLAGLTDRGLSDVTYHLGDLVGYAPFPDETVALLDKAGVPGVAGNYDTTVATDYAHCGCKYEDPEQERLSHVSYEWTRRHTGPRTKGWLGRLPFRMDLRAQGGHRPGRSVILVHGTPTLNTLYWHAERSDDFCRKMGDRAHARPGDVIAFGHTHVPWSRQVDGVTYVNAGSVGRPKDGDWRACMTLLDLSGEEPAVEFVRVPYDLEETCAAIRASTLPDFFADYLAAGGKVTAAGSAPDA
jgi:predicted phosphodiesterase